MSLNNETICREISEDKIVFCEKTSGVLAGGQGGQGPWPPSWQFLGRGAKMKRGRRILKVGGKKRIRKNIVTSAKKRCVYRFINRLSAQATK